MGGEQAQAWYGDGTSFVEHHDWSLSVTLGRHCWICSMVGHPLTWMGFWAQMPSLNDHFDLQVHIGSSPARGGVENKPSRNRKACNKACEMRATVMTA